MWLSMKNWKKKISLEHRDFPTPVFHDELNYLIN